ncbi:MAG TPA: Gfo/Idh/MocA family oxidoreductase [Tepidisphaeraceae bacterium]|jgi:predicted dehydrogenase
MKTIRIGFLGTGWIASVYAKALASMPDVRITALCNHHVEKAEAFNAKYTQGTAKCYADFGTMLGQSAIDALFVCVPPGAHTGQAEAAATAGIHLMLEKPIALSNARAASIAAAVRAANVKCQIGHHMRHSTPARKLKQMLTDGSAGRPLMMQGRFFVNALFPKWWRDPNMGGGQLIEQSIHLYDLARYFLGPADVITAFADKLAHQRFSDYRVDDVSASTIRFRNGAIASLCAANCAEPKSGSVNFTVLCENVIATFQDPDHATFVHHGGRVSEEFTEADGPVPREDVASSSNSYDELVSNFIDAIRNDAPLRSGIDDGVEGLRLVLAAAESSRQGGAPQAL